MKDKEKLSERIRVYLSMVEFRMVKKQAQDHGLTVPAYLRDLIRRRKEILRDR